MNDYGLLLPIPAGTIYRLSQGFGEHPADYAVYGLAGHNGLDYAAQRGTPVLAAHAGVVARGNEGTRGYGRFIKLFCPWMNTLYAHLDSYIVRDGWTVVAGQVIGYLGSTGNSTGPHLHFGWRVYGVANQAYLNYLDPAFGRKMKG